MEGVDAAILRNMLRQSTVCFVNYENSRKIPLAIISFL